MKLDHEVATILADSWGVEELVTRSRHQTSPGRTTWHVSSESGDLALKVDTSPHPSVLGGVGVQQHVSVRRHDLAPRPIPTISGDLAAVIRGCRVTVSEWIAGSTPPDEPATWSTIGQAAAALHGLPAAPRDFAIPLSLACEELRCQQGHPSDLVDAITSGVRRVHDHPQAVVHGQLNCANVITQSDGSPALLDWDEAGTAPTSVDLGYPLICEFLTEELVWRADCARAFFGSYAEAATTAVPDPVDIVATGLLFGLRSAMFTRRTARVERVRYAVEHESILREAIPW